MQFQEVINLGCKFQWFLHVFVVIIHTELTAQKNVKNIFWAGNLMYLENIAVNCGGRNTVIKLTYCKKNYHVLAFNKNRR